MTFLRVIAACSAFIALSPAMAAAQISFGQAYVQANVIAGIDPGAPYGGSPQQLETTFPASALVREITASAASPLSSATASALTSFTFNDVASGTLNYSASVGINANGDLAYTQALNDFFYDFTSATAFFIDINYEISSRSSTALMPSARFELGQGGDTLYSLKPLSDGGMAQTGVFDAGTYRVRIGTNGSVAVSGETGVQSTSIDANVYFAINEAAVPEPTTWAMMVGGFGIIGAAMRRRKISIAFA